MIRYTIAPQTPMWRLRHITSHVMSGYTAEAIHSLYPVVYSWDEDEMLTAGHAMLCNAVGLAADQHQGYRSFELPKTARPWQWVLVSRQYIHTATSG